MSGKPISSRIRSGCSFSAFWTASSPFKASVNRNSRLDRSTEQTNRRKASKSSTTSMLKDSTAPLPLDSNLVGLILREQRCFLKQTQFSFLNSKLRSATIQTNHNFRAYIDMRFIKVFPRLDGDLATELVQVL